MSSSMNINTLTYMNTIGIIVYYRNFTISRAIEINHLGIFKHSDQSNLVIYSLLIDIYI
jgi:hypothetical protein